MSRKTKSRFGIKEGRTTFTVDHLDGKLVFAYPAKGPDTYNKVAKQIDNELNPLYRPTTAETVSLIYSALQNKDDKYAQEVIKILRNQHFWCFTKNVWTPKGVYVVNDRDSPPINSVGLLPRLRNGRVINPINRNHEFRSKEGPEVLEKRLQSNDPNVRFVPIDKVIMGHHSVKELVKNPLVVAHIGEEGAEKLAEIASEFKSKPPVVKIGSTDEGYRPAGTSLGSDWFLSERFSFDCGCSDWSKEGYAFGLQKKPNRKQKKRRCK